MSKRPGLALGLPKKPSLQSRRLISSLFCPLMFDKTQAHTGCPQPPRFIRGMRHDFRTYVFYPSSRALLFFDVSLAWWGVILTVFSHRVATRYLRATSIRHATITRHTSRHASRLVT